MQTLIFSFCSSREDNCFCWESIGVLTNTFDLFGAKEAKFNAIKHQNGAGEFFWIYGIEVWLLCGGCEDIYAMYIRMLLQVVVPFRRYIQAVFYTSQASTLLAGPLFVS